MELEEEIPSTRWIMYFDGAVNNRGQGIGAVLVSPKKEYIPISIKLQFECTNNMAEYEACIAGLEAALILKVQEIDVFGDSILIICQTNGNWKTRESKLIPYNFYLESLAKKFKSITFTHLSRTKNHFADALATLASMLDISETMEVQPLAVRSQWAPAHIAEPLGEVVKASEAVADTAQRELSSVEIELELAPEWAADSGALS
ncbi:uncharacterized protein LOC143863459 [Tasmannia lanceolata]|uniref:uncharacterized protein LOC143863459 n=1 Tax=Tasmannia lanceolata TaxID=3420 RepID=UPI00406379F6